jgi:hypothetical protein
LPHGNQGDNLVHESGCRFGHSPCATRRTKASPLARKGHKLVNAAAWAADATKTASQYAAAQKTLELLPDELWHIAPLEGPLLQERLPVIGDESAMIR